MLQRRYPTKIVSRRRAKLFAFIVFAAISSAVIAATLIEVKPYKLMIFEAPDQATYDWRTALLSRREPQPRADIALLFIDYLSLSKYPYQMPLDRGLLAHIVQALSDAGAKAIGLDVIFDRPTDKDQLLIDAIRASKAPVVLGAIDHRMRGVGAQDLAFQQSFFAKAGHPLIGHVFLYPEQQGMGQPDQTVRFLPPHGQKDEISKSFAEALLEASGGQPTDVGELIAWLEPRAEDGAETFNIFLIPPHRPEDFTPNIILHPQWRDSVKGKVIIVGGNFEDRDRHLTPMSVVDGARMAGALIQAQILAQLLDGRSLRGLSFLQEFSLAIGLALLGILGGYWLHFKEHGFLVYAASLLSLIAVGAWLFKSHAVILPSDTTFYALTAGIAIGHYSHRIVNYLTKLRIA